MLVHDSIVSGIERVFLVSCFGCRCRVNIHVNEDSVCTLVSVG